MYWKVATYHKSVTRVYHASVAVGKYIFTFGGCYCGKQTSEEKMEVHVLHSETFQSFSLQVANKNGEDIPPNLLAHTAVDYCGRVYVWGGYHFSLPNDRSPSVLWCFDPSRKLWSRPATTGHVPRQRFHHASCVVGECMFVIGGFRPPDNTPAHKVLALHLPSLTWRVFHTSGTGPSCGIYRSVALAAARGGEEPGEVCTQICLYGVATVRTHVPTDGDQQNVQIAVGQATKKKLYEWRVRILDTATGEWSSASTSGLPTQAGGAGFVYDNYLYMRINKAPPFTEQGTLTRRFLLTTLDDNAFEIVKPRGIPHPAQCLGSCVVVNDRVFFIGGATPDEEKGRSRVPGSYFTSLFLNFWRGQRDHRPNLKVENLIEHYGSVQVLDFRPNLHALCISVISESSLDISKLPLVLQNEVQLCSQRYELQSSVFDTLGWISYKTLFAFFFIYLSMYYYLVLVVVYSS